MEKLADREFSTQLWKLLHYLESAYQYLENGDTTTVEGVEWGVDMDAEEPTATISFEVNPADARAKRIQINFLWIGLWLNQNGPRKDRLIWVQSLRNEKGIWEKIKNEFNDPMVIIDEDETAVGLPWLLSEEASNEGIKAAGEDLAKHVIKVLSIESGPGK